MATVAHLFAGVTDYFRAYAAKSYDDVLNNATKRFDPGAVSERRSQMVEGFRQQLNQNQNLTPDQVNAMVTARNARHAIGDFFENSMGFVGQGLSVAGGTVGYGTKKAAQAVFSKKGMKIGAGTTGVAGTGAGVYAAGSAVINNIDSIVGALPEAGAIAGTVAAGVAIKRYGPQVLDNIAESSVGQAIVKGGEAVANAPGIRHVNNAVDDVGRRVAVNAGITGVGSGIKESARWAGKGVSEYATNLGKDAWAGAKWFHENRNSRGVTLAAFGAAGVGIMGVPSNSTTDALSLSFTGAYQGGQYEEKYNHKMRQVASNMSVSNNGGGTFLRPNQAPQVENMGATGDLVFALHSLRNGG